MKTARTEVCRGEYVTGTSQRHPFLVLSSKLLSGSLAALGACCRELPLAWRSAPELVRKLQPLAGW